MIKIMIIIIFKKNGHYLLAITCWVNIDPPPG